MFAVGHQRQLFAEIGDENIDDLELWLVDSALQVAQKHLAGHGGALAQAEKLDDVVFFLGQLNRLVADRDDLGFDIDDKVSGSDRRLTPSGTRYYAGSGYLDRNGRWTH